MRYCRSTRTARQHLVIVVRILLQADYLTRCGCVGCFFDHTISLFVSIDFYGSGWRLGTPHNSSGIGGRRYPQIDRYIVASGGGEGLTIGNRAVALAVCHLGTDINGVLGFGGQVCQCPFNFRAECLAAATSLPRLFVVKAVFIVSDARYCLPIKSNACRDECMHTDIRCVIAHTGILYRQNTQAAVLLVVGYLALCGVVG